MLGAFQVAAERRPGQLEHPGDSGSGGIGGAMDLAAGGARVIAVLLPARDATAARSWSSASPTRRPRSAACGSVVTDLAWIDVDADGFLLRELAPGLTVDDVRAATGAPLRVASDVREMTFG